MSLDETELFGVLTVNLDELTRVGGQLLAIVVVAFVLQRIVRALIKRLQRMLLAGDRPSWTNRVTNRIAEELMDSKARDRRTQRIRTFCSVLTNVAGVAIWAIAALMAMSTVGIDTRPLLASAGIVGVAVGFGAQSLVKDFLTGMFMLLEDQYGVGDRVDLGDAKGTVEDVGMRVTRVRADDSTLWFVPNGAILRVGNLSQGWGRAVVDVTEIPNASRELVTEALQEAAEQVRSGRAGKDFAQHPNAVRVTSLPPTGSVARLVIQTTEHRQWSIVEQAAQSVIQRLDSAGVKVERARAEEDATQPLPLAVAPNADPVAFSTTMTAPNAAAQVILRVVKKD